MRNRETDQLVFRQREVEVVVRQTVTPELCPDLVNLMMLVV